MHKREATTIELEYIVVTRPVGHVTTVMAVSFEVFQEFDFRLLTCSNSHGLMVRRCFPVAKIVGSSPIGVASFLSYLFALMVFFLSPVL